MRDASVTTLADLTYATVGEALSVDSGADISVSPDMTSISIGTREVVATDDGITALASWVDFPQAFFNRLGNDLSIPLLNTMLDRKHERGVVRIGERTGILSVMAPGQVQFSPAMVVEAASRVLSPGARVIESVHTNSLYALDVVTAEPGNLGDPQIGDITSAGLRFSLNLAQNLSPKVSPYYYRLWCTNGASRLVEATKIDARGQTVDEVMAELEAKARIAFSLVEHEIEAFYALREEHVEHPERTLNRMALEHGLSDRLRQRVVDSLPALVEDMGNVSMFELINAVTHMANHPSVRTRGARESLESFGSVRIAQHIERCTACASKLN
jgi:hypothetical protein